MNIETLKNGGIAYEEGVKRFSGKSELYEKYLIKFLDDSGFCELENAMEQKQYEKAFKLAHTMKGIAGNLSFTGFYSNVSLLVECLRNKADIGGAINRFPALQKEYKALIDEIKEALS